MKGEGGGTNSLKGAECTAVGVVWERQADKRHHAKTSAVSCGLRMKRGRGDDEAVCFFSASPLN